MQFTIDMLNFLCKHHQLDVMHDDWNEECYDLMLKYVKIDFFSFCDSYAEIVIKEFGAPYGSF